MLEMGGLGLLQYGSELELEPPSVIFKDRHFPFLCLGSALYQFICSVLVLMPPFSVSHAFLSPSQYFFRDCCEDLLCELTCAP